MAAKALIVLADGFEETEAITTIDLLRRAGVNVTLVGLDAMEIRSSHDIYVGVDSVLEDVGGGFDAVILPGGMPGTTNLADSASLLEMIRKAFHNNRLCAAICAAPQVLAKADILQGKRATCYPGVEEKLRGATTCEDDVVVDGNVITSRGVGTAIPFALAIITYLVSKEAAEKVAEKVLYSK